MLFPGLTPKFNDSDMKEKFIYDNNLGVIAPYFKEGIGSTFYRELFKENYELEEISEKIRLFYVALTRAKEKMIFVLPMDEMEEEYDDKGLVTNNLRLAYRSFKDILVSIKSKVNMYIKDIDVNDLGLTNKYNIVTSNNLFEKIRESDKVIETSNTGRVLQTVKTYKRDFPNILRNILLLSFSEDNYSEYSYIVYIDTYRIKS